MNAKTVTPSISSRISRARFNPIRNLRPETLSSALDAFEDGRLGGAARIFEAILKRDDLISGLALKRKKSIARLEPHITLLEDSPKAREHKALLQKLYDGMEAENRADLQGVQKPDGRRRKSLKPFAFLVRARRLRIFKTGSGALKALAQAAA